MKNKVKILLALTLVCVMIVGSVIPANAEIIEDSCRCGSEAWEYLDSYTEYPEYDEDGHTAEYHTYYYCSMCPGIWHELMRLTRRFPH